MLTLYFAPGASSFAPHIALYEIGVPFEAKPMSFKQNDMRTPEFLAINPEGKVPTLLVDGRPLTEVAAILFYLAKRFPDAGLLPAGDIEAEAQVVSWMSFIASTLHPARQRGLDYAKQVYGIADRRLGSGWAIGPIRSPTSICSGCIGGSPIRFIPSPEMFPNLDRALRADDGAAGRAAHDRGRDRGGLRIAGVMARRAVSNTRRNPV